MYIFILIFTIFVIALFITWLKGYLDDIKDQNQKIIDLLEKKVRECDQQDKD